MTLAPGGYITFDGVIDIFVSNVAQSGKVCTLMVGTDSAIVNNPINPLSAGVPSNRYAIGAPNTSGSVLAFTRVALDLFTAFNVIPANQFPNGYLIKRVTLSCSMSDYRDVAYLYLDTGVGQLFYIVNIKGNSFDTIENVFVPGAYGLWIFVGPQFGVTCFGNIGVVYTGLLSEL